MKFKKVELHAFRAYKNKDFGTFDFTLPDDKIANFVSIYAPNGFGKTSFYDGVEWGITNRISRLDSYDGLANAERKFVEKESGSRKKQYILKNKETDVSVDGYVKIYTNFQEFSRSIPKILKAGGKDYSSKNTPENEYFKSVILSQDGIDDFLKADDDKERYKKFVKNFAYDGVAEYYENIVKLEIKNRDDKKDIDKDISKIEDMSKEPIDSKIFETSNEKIEKLNRDGEKFNLIDHSFDETKKLDFDNKLSQQKIELNGRVKYHQFLIDKLPNWSKDSEKYFSDKSNWQKQKRNLDDFIGLQEAKEKIVFLSNDIGKKRQSKSELENLRQVYPEYKNIVDDIEKKEKYTRELEYEQIKEQMSFNKLENAYNKTIADIELEEKKKYDLDDLISSIPKLFLDAKKMNESRTQAESLQKNKTRFESIQDAVKSNIFIDIAGNEKYKQQVKTIELMIEHVKKDTEALASIRNKKNKYQQYNKELKELLSLGVNIIDDTQVDTCPLCTTRHDSYNVLKSKILNNPLLNSVEKELLDDEEKVNFRIKENNKKIEREKESILSDFSNQLGEINKELSYLNYEMMKFDTSKLDGSTNEKEFAESKTKERNSLSERLASLYSEKKKAEPLVEKKRSGIEAISSSLQVNQKYIDDLKAKKEFQAIDNWIKTFESSIDILKTLDEKISSISKSIKIDLDNLEKLNNTSFSLQKKYSLVDLANLDTAIEELKDKTSKLNSEIIIFESAYELLFEDIPKDKESANRDIETKKKESQKSLNEHQKELEIISVLEKNTTNILKYIENKNREKELEELRGAFDLKEKVSNKLKDERERLEAKINKDVEAFFHEDLINQIYEKIDPHPDYKKVKFECSFEKSAGKLNVYVEDVKGSKHISPSLYYSTAQLNVLSLSIFLAKALNAKDNDGKNIDCIFIDDPIQSMDSINILATIDLLRSLVTNYNKQIILSTHDENFYYLLQKKIPEESFDSKFIELETFGKVKKN